MFYRISNRVADRFTEKKWIFLLLTDYVVKHTDYVISIDFRRPILLY